MKNLFVSKSKLTGTPPLSGKVVVEEAQVPEVLFFADNRSGVPNSLAHIKLLKIINKFVN